MKTVTVIGGGTGTFVVLSGLKAFPLDLGVIVTMMDTGSSTGILRDQLGVLPPGDLRQCLVALSDASSLWRELFLYRFDKGDLKGHNFGNIFLSALEKVSSDYQEVIDTAGFVLKTKGVVFPVTFEQAHICVRYETGEVVKEEENIDSNAKEKSRIVDAYIEPQVKPNPRAIERIEKSDVIIIGPGDIYTSIVPVLATPGISKAMKKTKAQIVFVMNLMTKAGQTTGYTAGDHLVDIEKYLGRRVDTVIMNNQPIPEFIHHWYVDHEEKEVINDLTGSKLLKVIEAAIIEDVPHGQRKGDMLMRSILRHNPQKLAKVIYESMR